MAFEYYRPDIKSPDKSQNPRLGDQKPSRSNIGIGFRFGYDNTTQSFVDTIGKEDRAKREYETRGETEITEALYNDPANNLAIEGVEWEPHMTFELIDEIKKSKKILRDFQENDSYSKYFGAFVGAAIDPVNLIPVPFAKGGGVIKTAGKIAAFNMATEGALTPLITKAYRAREEKFEFNDALFNIGMAGVLGGLLGGAGGVIGKGANKINELADATFGTGITIRGQQLLTNVSDTANKNVAKHLASLINQGIVRIDNIVKTTDNINGLDFVPNQKQYIDITGKVSKTKPTQDNSFIEISTNDAGIINITGNTEMIAKLRNQITSVLPANNRIRVAVNKDTVDYNTPQEMLESLNIKIKEGDISIRGNQDGLDELFQIQSVEGITTRLNKQGDYEFYETVKNKDGTETLGRKITDEGELANIRKRIEDYVPSEETISLAMKNRQSIKEGDVNTNEKASANAETDAKATAINNRDNTNSFLIANNIKGQVDEITDNTVFSFPTLTQIRRAATIQAGKEARLKYNIDDLRTLGLDIDADDALVVNNAPANLTKKQKLDRDLLIQSNKDIEGDQTFLKNFLQTLNCMRSKG